MIPQLAFISSQLHFHVSAGFIERLTRVLAFTLRLENSMRIQVQRAVGAVERTVVGEHDIRLRSAVEMLADNIFQTGAHADRKRLADLDLFT